MTSDMEKEREMGLDPRSDDRVLVSKRTAIVFVDELTPREERAYLSIHI